MPYFLGRFWVFLDFLLDQVVVEDTLLGSESNQCVFEVVI